MENNIPPTTAIPIETRLVDPDPKAKAMGKIPKIVHRLLLYDNDFDYISNSL